MRRCLFYLAAHLIVITLMCFASMIITSGKVQPAAGFITLIILSTLHSLPINKVFDESLNALGGIMLPVYMTNIGRIASVDLISLYDGSNTSYYCLAFNTDEQTLMDVASNPQSFQWTMRTAEVFKGNISNMGNEFDDVYPTVQGDGFFSFIAQK